MNYTVIWRPAARGLGVGCSEILFLRVNDCDHGKHIAREK